MALNKDRLSCGLDVAIAGDINAVLDESLTNFEFVCLPLFHPRFKRDFTNAKLKRNTPLTRSDFLLTSNDWTSTVVAKISSTIIMQLDSSDEVIRYNAEKSFQEEISYAIHLNVPVILVELRNSNCVNLARCLCTFMHEHNNSVVWVRVPLLPQQQLLDDLCSGDSNSHIFETQLKEFPLESTWNWWNKLITLMGYHPRIRVALELTNDLPPCDEIARWNGEVVKAMIVSTKLFLTNKKGFPVLPVKHQNFLKNLKSEIQIILTGHLRHKDKSMCHYKMYLDHLYQQRESLDVISSFSKGYEDYLQCPLQPLMNNLESQTYETFEKDPIKYSSYQKALYLALSELHSPEAEVVVMVLGAGRGPLVKATLKAAALAKRKVKVFAVEKNPYAVITLKNLKADEWGDAVTIVQEDMRLWQTDQKADIIVSELLGSFGDNELSPECLDGAERFLKENAISIPYKYTSYLAPVHSSKLWNEARTNKDPLKPSGSQFETPYIVRLYNCNLLDHTKPFCTFHHPRRTKPSSTLAHINTRHELLVFKANVDSVCHGFAGYFDCDLYKDITLSIEPATHTPSMFSWFPIYFPISSPIHVKKGHEIGVEFWRVVNDKNVWYEWCVTSPTISKIHNINGVSSNMGL